MEINSLIENFSIDNLKNFFRTKLRTFKPDNENYGYLFGDNEYINNNYQYIQKIGEADFSTDTDDILVLTAKTSTQLTNRTGKKKQYEIAKKILKEENKDAAFFIFYDDRNFRFSFLKANFLGTKRDFTSFKRYTYFVSKDQTNKTFINQISKCDFNSLDSIQEAFSVEPVTKEFYEKLQHWYFWAIENVEFPKDAEEETNGREVAVIRLITRLMFIWFMKVRNLIPNNLFNEKSINTILKDFSEDKPTYYKAILQNLFFATLNTRQKDRRFLSTIRGNRGYNQDWGNPYVYRYQNFFKEPEPFTKFFGDIPFLNGGLFECLDYVEKKIYFDGFRTAKKYQPKVPNFLFFSELKKKDLSRFYKKPKKNKRYEVQGLINLLESYNFTIDENMPDDVEVALDPELLGSIFENLLASYNPETSTTARKATGSFYTPREIVNYMTNESLKQYFKTNIADLDDKKLDSLISSDSENLFNQEVTKELINLINDLRVVDPAVGSGAFPMAMLNKLVFILTKLDPENRFWRQSQVSGVKKSVTDPTIQHKLIEQIKRQFKEKNADYGRKLYLIEKCIYGVDIQQIAVEIAKLRFFISLLVDEQIDPKKENSGIEPLPNLEFKLMQGNSLISEFAGFSFDDNKKENLEKDIKAKEMQLNNAKVDHHKTESEFMKIYNTEKREDKKLKAKIDKIAKNIKRLEKDKKRLHKTLQNEKDEINDDKYKNLIKNFEEIKTDYQNEADNKKKKLLREKIDKAIIKIVEEKISTDLPGLRKNIEGKAKQIPNKEQRKQYIYLEYQKLTKKFGFDIEQVEKDLTAYTEGRKQKEFFLWNIYFAEVFSEKGGFDVVIGNPPYIQLQKAVNNKQKYADLYRGEKYTTFERTGDIYALFYEKGLNVLNIKGLLCYITSNKWMRANYGKSLRKLISRKNPKKLIDMGPGVFNTATVDTNILLTANDVEQKHTSQLKALTFTKHHKINKLKNSDFSPIKNLNQDSWIILSPQEQKIKEKIERIGAPLKEWDINIYRGVLTGYNKAFIIDGKTKDELITKDSKSAEIIKPLLRGRDIKRYKAEFADLWLIFIPWHFPLHNDNAISGNSKKSEKAFQKKYSAIYEHLLQHKDKLSKRNKEETGIRYEWYALQRCAATYYKEFEKEKIVWKRIGSVIRFSYSKNSELCLDSTVIAVGNKIKYLTALLNSKLHIRELLINSPKTGTGDVIISVQALNPLLVHIPNNKTAKPFETLADKIISKKEAGKDTTTEEQKIDLMVYKLYELTFEEVKIVDPEFNMKKQEYENYG